MKFRAVMMAFVVGVLASAAEAQCVGDCDGTGEVTINGLVVGVNIALGNAAIVDCLSFDADGDGLVTINELIVGVNNALQGCPSSEETPTPTDTPEEATPTPTDTPEEPTPTATDTPEPPTPTPTATAITMTFSSLDFVAGQATGTCGTARKAGGVVIKNLACGITYVGGGASSAPPLDASPLKARFAVTGCTGTTCTLGPTSGPQPSPLDCTDLGCPIGPPVPVTMPLPTCSATTWGKAGEGSFDVSAGTASVILHSRAHTWLSANRTHPCPRCIGGMCESGARKGQACTSTNADGLTFDCLPGGTDGSADIGIITLDVPLTTDTQSRTTPDGAFCLGQDAIRPGLPGCFGLTTCRTIDIAGTPAAGGFLPTGSSHAVTLSALACVPAQNNALVDATSDLPGPAVEALTGTITVNP
jgi:hypothetical protein